MKKQFIRLNNNDEHLSIGNLFRLIKELSKNKTSALQSELFCTLFEIETINDTTVNNYCVGCRSIGSDYKQIYLNKVKRYERNKEEFADNIIGIGEIIDGVIYNIHDNKVSFINNNESLRKLVNKLYNLAKNDRLVDEEFTHKIKSLIDSNDYYEAFVQLLIYIVLYKRQPLYEDELKKEVIDNVLNDTSISSLDLQEYLSLKLREGINFDYSMKELAKKGNAYANFELGSNEYYGYVKGFPRYEEAYNYLIKAALMDHASANYMIGNMYIKGLIGSQSNDDLQKGYEFLLKSYELGNVAACNQIGNMYLDGVYPLKANQDEAIKYFIKAADKSYAFALNNLGKLKEKENNYQEAFDYYLKSAILGESWACNKVGEYYRLGKIEKDMEKAFSFYNQALESNYRTLCYYAYYNLAKYFYMDGNIAIGVKKDQDKALEYLKIASDNNLLVATLEIFYFLVNKYLENKDSNVMNEIMIYKEKIENSPLYDDKMRKEIEDNLEKIKNVKKIDLNWLNEV